MVLMPLTPRVLMPPVASSPEPRETSRGLGVVLVEDGPGRSERMRSLYAGWHAHYALVTEAHTLARVEAVRTGLPVLVDLPRVPRGDPDDLTWVPRLDTHDLTWRLLRLPLRFAPIPPAGPSRLLGVTRFALLTFGASHA